MKRILLSLVAIATLSLSSFGQAPEGFKYQAVVRDAGNTILSNQAVGMQMTIQQGSVGGTTVYQETFAPTTNAYGLVNLEIGTGTTSYDFTTIDWANGPYFMETAVDLTGGTSYTVMGTSQLMSVPYALYANTAENVTNDLVDDADADPNNEIQTISRTGTTVTLSNGGTFEDSLGVYIAGTGIDITNNVVSATEPTYTIGLWPELGGYVFWVSGDGKHGLVHETQDQGTATWYEAQNLISNPSNHSVNGQKFRDWRLPTKYELNEMYLQQLAVGGFANSFYWSSTEFDSDDAWLQYFFDGIQANYDKLDGNLGVRSVRAF